MRLRGWGRRGGVVVRRAWWGAVVGGARGRGGRPPGVRGGRSQGRGTGVWGGQGLEAADALEEEMGPGVVGPVADEGAAGA